MSIGEFSVLAGKDPLNPKLETKILSEIEGPWRHFVCVLPKRFGLHVPVHANTLEMQQFNADFKISIPMNGLNVAEGFSIPSGLNFTVNSEQLTHSDQILSDQPFLLNLRLAVDLLDRCLGRKMGYSEFITQLNDIGLPTIWRNELANGVFTSVTPLPGFETQPAEQFIAEVGLAGTGFALNQTEAETFRQGIADLLKDSEIQLLEQQEIADAMGFIAGLQRLIKRMRGPRHLHFHLLPASISDDVYRLHWEDVLSQHPGSVETFIYLTAGNPDEDTAQKFWLQRFSQSLSGVLIQSSNKDSAAWLAWGKTVVNPVYVFQGGVAGSIGNQHFFKPAALAYIEALLENGAHLPLASQETWGLSDLDFNPKTGSAADVVYDSESLIDLRSRGIHVPVAFKNRAELNFLPLISAQSIQ